MNVKKTTKDVAVTVLTPRQEHVEYKLFARQLGVSLGGFFRLAAREYKIRQDNLKRAA